MMLQSETKHTAATSELSFTSGPKVRTYDNDVIAHVCVERKDGYDWIQDREVVNVGVGSEG